jgi:hypothetical protein
MKAEIGCDTKYERLIAEVKVQPKVEQEHQGASA